MTKSVSVRRASKQDLEAVDKLSIQWQQEGSTIGQGVADFLPYFNEGAYLFVGEEDSSIVGFMAAEQKLDRLAVFDSTDPYIELEELYVVPEKRSEGVGSLLVNALKDAGNRDGIRHFHVYSSSRELDRVVSFYRKHGFGVWSIQAFADTSAQ
jgi:ribosomal protein S18 acetylase RimI-like enzyme|tara:strand:+ start:300 stop:758 length:459 start_codon:yes stop_codon:yes gene_type:complete